MYLQKPLAGYSSSALESQPPGQRALRREALFCETPSEVLQRTVFGTLWAAHPKRLGRLPDLARLWVEHLFEPADELPDPATAPDTREYLGIADDLSVPTLAVAYARGMFPHSHVGPAKWLSPRERCVLFFDAFHMAKRLRRLMRQGQYTVTFDQDFDAVIKACAGKRSGRPYLTWITPRIMRAYAALYDAGFAHSFEVWNREGVLVGGGYGVAIGGVFFTESQFSLEPNTSKLGFSVLNWHLDHWGYALNDGKWATPTILGMGFRMIPRNTFVRLLGENTQNGGRPGRWTVEAGPDVVADWRPENSPQHAVDNPKSDERNP